MAELAKSASNEKLFGTLATGTTVVAPVDLPVSAGDVQIWVQPSRTETDITSWSTTGS